MMQFVNWRMRVTISDTRTLVGTLMAFDKHLNIVLGDCEEYRTSKGKKSTGEKEEKRALGLVLLRGETVVSLSAEAPPPPKPRAKAGARGGPGTGQVAGRGMPVTPLASAPKGLQGPVRGLGGPGQAVMMPQVSAPPVNYGRGGPVTTPRPTTPGTPMQQQPRPQQPQQTQPSPQQQQPQQQQQQPVQQMGRGGPPPQQMMQQMQQMQQMQMQQQMQMFGRGGPPMGFPGVPPSPFGRGGPTFPPTGPPPSHR